MQKNYRNYFWDVTPTWAVSNVLRLTEQKQDMQCISDKWPVQSVLYGEFDVKKESFSGWIVTAHQSLHVFQSWVLCSAGEPQFISVLLNTSSCNTGPKHALGNQCSNLDISLILVLMFEALIYPWRLLACGFEIFSSGLGMV